MENIQKHIEEDNKKINDPMISSQSRRHYEEELLALQKYQERHPNNDYDPSNLELFCDENPGAIECRIYEN
jgi:hypothetical protein